MHITKGFACCAVSTLAFSLSCAVDGAFFKGEGIEASRQPLPHFLPQLHFTFAHLR